MATGTDALEAALQERIVELVSASAPGKTICPTMVAQAHRTENWQQLMKPVRRAAVALAKEGRMRYSEKVNLYRPIKPRA